MRWSRREGGVPCGMRRAAFFPVQESTVLKPDGRCATMEMQRRHDVEHNQAMIIPTLFKKDIERAIEILRKEGCAEIFLFGSLLGGHESTSDIDIAIRGCPEGAFFRLLGRLLMELEHPVDLIDLDSLNPFAQYLEKEGNLSRIA
jgi:predicted nucleotidyltransferase